MPGLSFPDVEELVRLYLTSVLTEVHACIELPPAEEFDRLLPIVSLNRIGGATSAGTWSHGHLIDRPTLHLDMYAGDRQAVNTLAQIVRQSLNPVGAALAAAGVIRARELAGPAWRPDPTSNVQRIGLTVGLLVRSTS